MNKNWENCYVGLPYKLGGRDRSGIDCWGLVRLIHKEQMGIDLPAFADVISLEDQAETINREKEGWNPVVIEQTGDVVLFNILGNATHVGIVTRPGFFIHAFENQDVRVERLDSAKWKKRIAGIYRYSAESKGANLIGLAHPLKTERIDTVVEAGKTLAELHIKMKQLANVSEDYDSFAIIYVDSKLVPKEQWETTVVQNGQRVEYRATVQGGGGGLGGIFKVVAAVALAYFAPMMAGQLYSALGGTFVMANASAIITGMTIGINVLGGVLLNAIFPTRPPSIDSPSVYANEEGTPSYFLQGGNNQANKFGAIPVVLGTMRYTPPIAAETYAEAEDVNSYLRMVLCWGYGPLQVSNITIGDDPLSNYSEVQIETLQGYSTDNRSTFDSIYGQDVEQQRVGVELTDTTTWVTRVLDEEVDQLSFMFEYQNGLYSMNEQTGVKSEATSGIAVQYRPIGTNDWNISKYNVAAGKFSLPPSYKEEYVVGDSSQTTYLDSYTWSSIVVSQDGNLIIKRGIPVPEIDQDAYMWPPSVRARFGISGFDTNPNKYSRFPSIGTGEIELFRICTKDSNVVSSYAVNTPFSGLTLSISGLTVDVSSGVVVNPNPAVYLVKKALSPFVKTLTIDVPMGKYEVRVRRTTAGYSSYDAYRVSFASITGYKNTKPIVFKKPLAMSAIRIKSSNQFNGQVDGFVGTVSSICKKWDGSTWVNGTTSNPAALYRYVLQHPANPKPLTDDKIDLVALQDWYEYCEANGFQYNNVLTGQKSLYEVLKDIAAAGRASPTRYNSKWSVIVDKPRDSIVQHLTPHNSWGFEGVKNLPKLPHAFKVSFVNESKTFQPDELFVYNDGYSESNATLFEGLELPGITNPTIVHKHARFHMAQLKLRPEVYTLNADIEHLVCNRGDLVRVTHDTPMWGLGSGRIKQKVSSTELLLDEPVPMQAGKQYTIRIRNQDGSSTVKTVASKPSDGYYDSVILTAALGVNQGVEQDLFLFGELNSESVDLIVLSVEPSSNLTARLTLVDYSPAIYELDSAAIPAFDSKITSLPGLLRKRITAKPNISVQSGDYAITEVSPGVYRYGMLVRWDTVATDVSIDAVEVQIDWAGDNTDDWLISKKSSVTENSALFNEELLVGEGYVVRARYVNNQGLTGPWSDEVQHYIEGKDAKPLDVQDFLIYGNIFSWQNQIAPDIAGYKIKYSYANNPSWEAATDLTSGLILSSPYQAIEVPEGTVTFFIKAVDSLGNESNTPARIVRNMGDSPVANVIAQYDYETANYPGSITNGSIVGTDILADSNSRMYQADSLIFYGNSSDVFYKDNYSAITWESAAYLPSQVLLGSNLTLSYEFDGNSPQILYRQTPTTIFYGLDASPFYGLDSSTFYNSQATDWKPWPGILPAELTEYQFKFVDTDGAVQGRLNSFKVIVDAPDKVLRLNDVAISASGTRLTDAIGMFDTVLNIQLTLQNSTADVLYAEDKSVTLGPLIKAKQGGVGVTATVDAFLQGY